MYAIRSYYGRASDSSQRLRWLVPTVPVVGALLAGLVQYWIRTPGEGPGVTKVMDAIHRRKAQIPWYVVVRKWLASTLSYNFV